MPYSFILERGGRHASVNRDVRMARVTDAVESELEPCSVAAQWEPPTGSGERFEEESGTPQPETLEP